MILLKRTNGDLCERRMTTRATTRELRANQTCRARRESWDSEGVTGCVQGVDEAHLATTVDGETRMLHRRTDVADA